MSVGPADRQRDLTVVHVRERPELDVVEVMFRESARIFRVSRSHANVDRLVATLKASEAGGRPVRVTLTTAQGADIDDVEV